MSVHGCPSLYRLKATPRGTWVTSLWHSSTTIAYVKCILSTFQVLEGKKSWQHCSSHSRHSHLYGLCSCPRKKMCRSFLPRSWVDPHQRCNHSPCNTSHFLVYQNYFCLPSTLLTLVFGTFLIPGIFHQKRWSLPFPC